eukprot:Pgem_evm2s8486
MKTTCVLAIACICASSVHARGGVQLGNGDFTFQYTANIIGHDSLPQVSGVSVHSQSSGCGGSNQKCSCKIDSFNVKEKTVSVLMRGTGTDGTATGLDFQCKFNVEFVDGTKCACNLHIDIPYIGSNSWEHDCPCLSGFNWSPSGGHVIKGQDNLLENK